MSYSNHDLELVKRVKDGLEYRGLDSFMAKYDIPTSEDWKEEILRNLNECEIFIAFLNSNYKKSDWADHESGIAFIKGKFIITINLECAAYGFLSPFQSYEFSGNIAEVCDEILNTILSMALSDTIKDGVIRHFAASPHFKEARDNTAILEKIESFTTEQIHELMRAVIDNNQLHGINIPKSFVYKIVQEHHGTIDKGLLKKFEPFLP